MFCLSKLCILCLSTYKKNEPVLNEKTEELLIQKKLKYCLPEIIDSHSAIPKYICSNCMNKLECFYKFKQICVQNDTYLKNYFQTLSSTAGESYQNLSVKLTDIKYLNKQQTVNIEQTMSTVGSDEELRTEEKEDNVIYIKEDVKNEAQCVDGLDIEESHLLCETENNIEIKEEIPISEDNADTEFYYDYVKNIIQCELVPSDSDVSVSEIEDIVHEDFKLTKPTEQNKIRKIKKFQCAICGREYSRKILLRFHLKDHSGVRDYKCTICGKKFIQKYHLIRHEKIHTGIKNFECLICKKKFMRKGSLVEHEKIHTGIKNFGCSMCKKKFTQKSHLVEHEKIHTGIKNYECSMCKKKFMRKGCLVEHEKIHTGIKNFECSICKKKFTQKSHLVEHEKRHTGIKNFECSICKKKFTQKSHLVQHEKSHTGIKNYECSMCKKKFMRKGSLVEHEKIHTGIKN